MSKLSGLPKLVYDEYKKDVYGSANRYLTDTMKRALVASAVYYVMLTRYETEEEKEKHTSPNIYVDAYREVIAWMEL